MPKSKELISSDSDSDASDPKPKKAKKDKSKEKSSSTKSAASTGVRGEDGEVMYPLSKQRNVSVSEFRGKPLVNIREYYEKDGKMLPGRKGISLNLEQWNKLKSYISDIDSELARI
ncbi:activated RNA polymerase II transcriptional coactivator p15-like [Watersipora subatra]|uniref:activated RNA polymerase II transcriptional coactivator p15-like n=1 Tax=Watersipora subatra TaxID=2589382 RepID=UPI00355C7B8E